MTEYHVRAPYDRVVHVVPQGASIAQLQRVATEAYPLRQSIMFSVDDACLPINGLTLRKLIFWGIPAAQQQGYRDFIATYYPAPDIPTVVEFRVLDTPSTDPPVVQPPVVQPPPTPVPTNWAIRIGVNAIANHHIQAGYADQGCRFWQVLDNVEVAAQLAQRTGAVVMNRHFVGWHMDAAQLAAHARFGNPPWGLILTLLNEQDAGFNYDTPEALNHRLDVELGAAQMLLDEGRRVGLGGWSMGTLDFLNPALCDIVARRMAPMFNRNPRCYLNMHLYSPRMERLIGARALATATIPAESPDLARLDRLEVVVGRDSHVATVGVSRDARGIPAAIADTDWFETRWRFLFWACGFDPTARDDLGRPKIISDEMGEDEGGVGGAPAHHRTVAQHAAYCAAWRALQAQSIVVNGRTYPSPFMGGALFQSGNNSNWAGYQVDGYLPGMRSEMGWA
jgi:hypothetical protein